MSHSSHRLFFRILNGYVPSAIWYTYISWLALLSPINIDVVKWSWSVIDDNDDDAIRLEKDSCPL